MRGSSYVPLLAKMKNKIGSLSQFSVSGVKYDLSPPYCSQILHHERNSKAFGIDAQNIVYNFVVRPEYIVLNVQALVSFRQQLSSPGHQVA